MSLGPDASDAQPAWWNIHARLMPDYNRAATTYWWSVVALGSVIAVLCAIRLSDAAADVWTQVAACAGLAMLAGLVPVRVPGSTNSFTAGEVFIFLLLLLHGVHAAALASACEAFLASCRTSKRWTSRIGSFAMAGLALFASGSAFDAARAARDGTLLSDPSWLVVAAIGFALLYFVINTLLVTMVPRLKKNERIDVRSLFSSFGWLGLAYSANAAVATLLYVTFRQVGMVALIAAAPVIAILLSTGHYYFRRKEADAAVRAAQQSEAERARQHVIDLKASERRFHSAFTYASIGMALVAYDGRVRQANVALQRLLGEGDGTPERLIFNDFQCTDGRNTLANLVAGLPGRAEPFSAEMRYRHSGGHDLWLAVHGSVFAEVSQEDCLILQVQDITARKRAETDLQHIAFHDGLTGLPNRHRFHQMLSGAIDRLVVSPEDSYGVLFLDFDRFKLINDSLGHTVGDEFLIQVSRRLLAAIRPGDVVARLGGDEFAILVQDKQAPTTIIALAERLQQSLREPFLIAGNDVTVTASIGITVSALGYERPEDVLRDADIAMYRAKAAGKARHVVFDIAFREQATQRLRLEVELRRALTAGGLSVEYQPLFDLTCTPRRLIGFEALARWKHSELGNISPATFIPVAEESGAMVQLTDFVLASACAQLKQWHEVDARFGQLKMHVNIAGNDVAASNLVTRVACAVVAARLRPEHLSIELTENILMESLEAAMGTLRELNQLGIGLSVDDFGTGYSSLSHLSNLPIDSLKIDRSFVKNLVPGSKEFAVIRSIVLLGKSLGKEVIAEGIETQEQLVALRELGCEVGQGYLMGRPLTPAAVNTLLLAEIRNMGETSASSDPGLSSSHESRAQALH